MFTTISYIAIRLILWGFAVGIGLFPILSELPDSLTVKPYILALSINDAGHFRDVFFVVVTIAALGLSTVTDFLTNCYGKMHPAAWNAALICLLLNIICLTAGLVGFLEFAPNQAIANPSKVAVYTTIVMLAACFGLMTEVCVAFVSHRVHERNQTARQRM